MTPARYSFTIYQGATFERQIRLLDSQQQPVPTVGATSRMQFRNSPQSEVILLDVQEGQGLTTSDDGVITIEIADEVTALLTFQEAVYDLKLSFPGGMLGKAWRVIEGTAILSPQVTREPPP